MHKYEVFSQHCKNTLKIEGRTDPNIYFYKSLPICILDAVYSIGVRYSSTAKVTERYIANFNLTISREKIDENEHTIDDFLKNIEVSGDSAAFAEKVVKNRQRTSSRNGILKAEACKLVATVFKSHGINTLTDFAKYDNKSELDKDILAVKGQGSGIMLKYLYMLAGNENLIKPDRQMERFIKTVFPEMKTYEEYQDLISGTVKLLKTDFPNMTPRLLDYLIWEYQKSQKNQKNK